MSSRMKTKARTQDTEELSVSEFRQIRIERYGTLEDAAKEIGLSAAVIQRLETKGTKPTATTIRKYSRGIGVPVRRLLKFYNSVN